MPNVWSFYIPLSMIGPSDFNHHWGRWPPLIRSRSFMSLDLVTLPIEIIINILRFFRVREKNKIYFSNFFLLLNCYNWWLSGSGCLCLSIFLLRYLVNGMFIEAWCVLRPSRKAKQNLTLRLLFRVIDSLRYKYVFFVSSLQNSIRE